MLKPNSCFLPETMEGPDLFKLTPVARFRGTSPKQDIKKDM